MARRFCANTSANEKIWGVGDDFNSTRLVGRSVWNDHWILVIPASALGADRERALETFVNGVGDIKIGIRAYSRQGN